MHGIAATHRVDTLPTGEGVPKQKRWCLHRRSYPGSDDASGRNELAESDEFGVLGTHEARKMIKGWRPKFTNDDRRSPASEKGVKLVSLAWGMLVR